MDPQVDPASILALVDELQRSGIGRHWGTGPDDRQSAANLAVAEALARAEDVIDRESLFRRYRQLLRTARGHLARTAREEPFHELHPHETARSPLPSPEELASLRERFELAASTFGPLDHVLGALGSRPASLLAEALDIAPERLAAALAERQIGLARRGRDKGRQAACHRALRLTARDGTTP